MQKVKRHTKLLLTTGIITCLLLFFGMSVISAGATTEVATYSELVTALTSASDGDTIGIAGIIDIPAMSTLGFSDKQIVFKRSNSSSQIRLPSNDNNGYFTTIQNIIFDGDNLSAPLTYVSVSNSTTFDNCSFKNSISSLGVGALKISNGEIRLTNCSFSNNAGVYGGHIMNTSSNVVYIDTCTFTSGSATVQGGALCSDSSNNTYQISNSVITGNSAGYYGGGIANHGSLTCTNTKIYNNTATSGGADIYNVGWKSLDSIATLTSLFSADNITPLAWISDVAGDTTETYIKLDYEVIPTATPSPSLEPSSTPLPTVEVVTPTLEPVITEEPTSVPSASPLPSVEPVSPSPEISPSIAPSDIPVPSITEIPISNPEPTSPEPISTPQPIISSVPSTPEPTSIIVPSATPVPIQVIPPSNNSSSSVVINTVTPVPTVEVSPSVKPSVSPSLIPLPTKKPVTSTPKPTPHAIKQESSTGGSSTVKATPTPKITSTSSKNSDTAYTESLSSQSASSNLSGAYLSGSQANTSVTPTSPVVSPTPSVALADPVSSTDTLNNLPLGKNIKIDAKGVDLVYEETENGYSISINANNTSQDPAPTVEDQTSSDKQDTNWIQIAILILLALLVVSNLRNLIPSKPKKEE